MNMKLILPAWLRHIKASSLLRFQQGKGSGVFILGVGLVGFVLAYALLSRDPHAASISSLYAILLSALIFGVGRGLSLNLAIHFGVGLSAIVMLYGVWYSGGIYSSCLVCLSVLPLAPLYANQRQSGYLWGWLVLGLQLLVAMANQLGWIPAFETGAAAVLSSYITYTLVCCLLIVMPLVYDRVYREALAVSRNHQRELEVRREELEQTSKMREQFIAIVSHELRTPMNAILGFNALLLARLGDKPEARKVLNHTRQSADHLMTVINDILDYSQSQAGHLVIHPEIFELRKTVEHAFELFWPRVKSMELTYRIELDEGLPQWVHTDRHRLMQVLVNLLGNALKFTHQGQVLLRVQWQNPGVLFSVQDTGIGIAKDRQAQIFNRFSQANADIQSLYGGNGLGLAISRTLVQLLGGDIGFESEPGQGSRFWFHLPLTACPAPEQKQVTQRTEVQTAQLPWRFLIADDHPVNRLLVRQVLTNAWPHSHIIEAADGQQAVAVLREQAIDLVLMDMVMPVMDGIVATQTIRTQLQGAARDVLILGLTANVNPVDLDAFRQKGLNDVMLKPFEPDLLCAKVEHWLLQRD